MTMVSTPMNVNEVFAALETWIKQKPGLDPADYGLGRGQTPDRKQWWEARKAYQAEIRSIGKDRIRAMKALDEARGLEPARPDLLADAFQRAFSGRLQWFGDCEECIDQKESICKHHDYGSPKRGLRYCAGQYFPTEYRKAAASVLETYIATWQQAHAKEHPQTFTYRTMDDVKAANRSVGGHWFDPSTMRFFNTKIESGLIACEWIPATNTAPARPTKGRFISSEKGPDGVRRFTIREAQPDGSIDTIGEFQGYRTRDAARAAILK